MKVNYIMNYLIVIIILLYSCIVEAKSKGVVGLLSTYEETYEGEFFTAVSITKMLKEMGSEVTIIDYNKIVKNCDEDSIKSAVYNFIKQNRIDKIIIPGNYFNVSSEPLSPNDHRQLVTNAIVEIIEENPKIRIMPICGGLQGVMKAKGVEIIRLEEITDRESAGSHLISSHPRSVKANLHKVIVNLNSRLGRIIIARSNSYDSYGNAIVYFPDYHAEGIDNSYDNVKKLKNLGYKIVGFSEDGMIEVLEDRFGNTYFQNHPEYLAINAKSKFDGNSHSAKNNSILVSLDVIKDFLETE